MSFQLKNVSLRIIFRKLVILLYRFCANKLLCHLWHIFRHSFPEIISIADILSFIKGGFTNE